MNVIVDNTMNLRGANNIASTPNNNNNLVDENKDKSGRKEDGSGEDALRPKVYDGDILELFTINGAVVSIILETDGTYNNEIYETLRKLDIKSILPHVSICDKNISSSSRFTAIGGIKYNETISLDYIYYDNVNNNNIVFTVSINSGGTYSKTYRIINDNILDDYIIFNCGTSNINIE